MTYVYLGAKIVMFSTNYLSKNVILGLKIVIENFLLLAKGDENVTFDIETFLA